MINKKSPFVLKLEFQKMKNHLHLIGLSKEEVLKELGDDFNFFPNNRWTYFLKRNFWQQNVILILFFEDNVVVKIEHLKTYKKNCP